MDIKRIIKEEIDDFNWIRESDPIEQLDYYYDNMFNEGNINPDDGPLYFPVNRIIASKLLKKLEVDYDNMFSSTITDICTWGLPTPSHEKYGSVSIVKRILCHDDFKKPEIKKLLKDYYKKRIKQLKKLLGHPSSTWETIKRYNPFYSMLLWILFSASQYFLCIPQCSDQVVLLFLYFVLSPAFCSLFLVLSFSFDFPNSCSHS